MSNVTTLIITGIKAQLAAALPGFKELPYVNDPSRNSFRQAQDAYGIRPGQVDEQSGVMRTLTYTETFEFVVCGVYGNDSVNDQAATAKALELLTAIKTAHKQLVISRCGAPAHVMLVNGLSIGSPQYDTQEKLITVEATLDVTYRIQF